MTIKRSTYDAYSNALDEVQATVIEEAQAILNLWTVNGGSLSAEEVIAKLQKLVDVYGSVARTVANEFCERVLIENGVTSFATAESAKTGTSALVTEMEAADGSTAKLAQAVGKVVMQSADSQVMSNAIKSGGSWAVVANAGACEWCLMQSSLGWNFKSTATANSVRHSNCRCKVVMDVGKVGSLSGYDPDEIREEWADERQARLEREAERAAKKAAQEAAE